MSELSTLESQASAVEFLVEASRSGRRIVPLMGAGISIESGVLPIAEVTRYLAKVQFYVRRRVFRDRLSEPGPDGSTSLTDVYRYLKKMGWPDPGQLDADLWYWLSRQGPAVGESESKPTDGYPDRPAVWMDRLVEMEILADLGRIDEGLKDTLSKVLADSGEPTLGLRGAYWRNLLSSLTRSDPDLVDSLFHKIIQRRRPGSSHRFLAQLANLLRLRLILTTNFDPLIEHALQEEGHSPRIYEVGAGQILPHPSLVGQELSVLKLHGGAHGLVIGERLNQPVDSETTRRFKGYFQDGSILVVLGFSGWDQRILDLVHQAVEQPKGAAEDRNSGRQVVNVLWLHFESEIPSPVQVLRSRFERSFGCVQVRSPSSFLRQLYRRRAHAHPPFARTLRTEDRRPLLVNPDGSPVSTKKAGRRTIDRDWRRPIVVFSEQAGEDDPSRRLAQFAAAQASRYRVIWIDLESVFTAADLIVEIFLKLKQYDPSLPPELFPAERSLAGQSSRQTGSWDPSKLFRREGGLLTFARGAMKSRRFASSTPAEASPDPWVVEKVLHRLSLALRRGRYLIALNGVEAMGRAPTQHHGLPRSEEREDLFSGSAFVGRLLECLARSRCQRREHTDWEMLCHDSILAVSRCRITLRHEDGTSPKEDSITKQAFAVLQELSKDEESDPNPGGVVSWNPPIGSGSSRAVRNLEQVLPETLPGSDNEDLFVISAFRRRRSVVGLAIVFRRLLNIDDIGTQQILQQREREGFLWRVDGGDYWMARTLRDRIYGSNDKYVRSQALQDNADNPDLVGITSRALNQLWKTHAAIADYYETRFASTRETFALIECIYHQITTLKYLTKLSAWQSSASSESLDDDQSRDRVSDPDRLRRARIYSLHGLLERYREYLLREVTGPELVTLARWIRRHDLGRFMRPFCLGFGERPTGRKAFEAALKAGALQEKYGRTEQEIFRKVQELTDFLQDLQAAVLQDRMNADDLVELRRPRLADWLEEKVPGRIDLASAVSWMEAPGRSGISIKEWEGEGRPLEILMQLAAASRFTLEPDHIDPSAIRRGLGGLAACSQLSDRNAVSALTGRLEADLLLSGLSPWDLKGTTLAKLRSIRGKDGAARSAIRTCSEAVEALRQVPDGDWIRWCREPRTPFFSYLHSLQGRGHYLLGEFRDAFSLLERSRGGLDEGLEDNQAAVAVSLLRQAECLMLQADQRITEWSLEQTIAGNPLPSDPKELLRWLSEEGRRKLGGEEIDKESLQQLLRQCISNWNLRELMQIHTGWDPPGDLDACLEGSRQRLETAGDLLERAERILDHSRRTLEWWGCLYQLRAQLEIERLFLHITTPPAYSASVRDPDEIEYMRSSMRRAIRAVRRGLDILLPSRSRRNPSELRSNFLVTRLIRQWVEVLVCSGYLTLWSGQKAILRNGDELWDRWKLANQREGIRYLFGSDELVQWFKCDVRNFPQFRSPGITTRAEVLTAISRCLRLSHVNDKDITATTLLLKQLCEEQVDGRLTVD